MVKNPPANAGDLRDTDRFHPWVQRIPWRRKRQPTPVLLPRESHGQRSLAGYNYRVTKSWTGLKRLSMLASDSQ